RRLVALSRCSLQALFASIALHGSALQGSGVRVDMQATALAVEQQWRTGAQQQHRSTSTDQGGNPQGARDDGAVSGGTTAGSQNAGYAGRVQARNVRRADFIH